MNYQTFLLAIHLVHTYDEHDASFWVFRALKVVRYYSRSIISSIPYLELVQWRLLTLCWSLSLQKTDKLHQTSKVRRVDGVWLWCTCCCLRCRWLFPCAVIEPSISSCLQDPMCKRKHLCSSCPVFDYPTRRFVPVLSRPPYTYHSIPGQYWESWDFPAARDVAAQLIHPWADSNSPVTCEHVHKNQVPSATLLQ